MQNAIFLTCTLFFFSGFIWTCKNDTSSSAATASVTERGAKTPEELMTRLKAAFEKKDARLLAPLLGDRVSDGYTEGGASCGEEGCPPDTFIYRRTVESENLWDAFGEAFQHGFRNNGKDILTAPWYTDTLEQGNYVFITGKNVNIRTAPGKTAPVLGQKSEEVIEYATQRVYDEHLDEETDDMIVLKKDSLDWLKVKMSNGRMGYMALDYALFHPNYIVFKKIAGRWYVISLNDHNYVCAL